MITKNLMFCYFLITLGTSFQFGYQTGVINPIIEVLQNFTLGVSSSRGTSFGQDTMIIIITFVTAAFAIGGIVGALLGAFVSNALGRKMALFIFSIPTLLGAILMMIAKSVQSFESIIVGRFVIGVSCGAYTGIAPTMLSEFAPIKIRGASGIVNQLVIVSAILLSQILGLPNILGNANFWPYLLGFPIIPCLLQLAILPFCPESPRYLMLVKKDKLAAKQALRWLRGIEYPIEIEINSMEDELASTPAVSSANTEQNSGLRDLFKYQYLRLAIFVSIVCHLSQQFSGINAVLNYSSALFTSAGVAAEKAVYATLGIGLINLLVTVGSIFLIEHYGRRKLLLTGLLGMLASSFMMMVCLIVRHYQFFATYIAIAFAYLFVGFFAIGPGSIPWFIVTEIFSQDSRDAAVATTVLVNWVSQIVVLLIYPKMLYSFGDYSFLPFIVLLAIFIAILFKYLPETKDRSHMDLIKMFKDHTGESLEEEEPQDSQNSLLSGAERNLCNTSGHQ